MEEGNRKRRDWLSPADCAIMWDVDPKTARARLEAIDRELKGTFLLRSEGRKREHVRVHASKLARYFELRPATVPSATLRLVRSIAVRVDELEQLIETAAAG